MVSLQYTESVVAACSPEEAYDMVSDITRMGEWSPVCKACWWDEGDGPRVGAWFTGRNEVPGRVWETRSRVVAAERGREFAFAVGGAWARWGYSFRPVDGGTEITESWEFLPAGIERFRERFGDDADAQIADRAANARTGIPATLAAIRKAAGSGRSPADGRGAAREAGRLAQAGVMPMDPVSQLSLALDTMGQVIAGVREQQWACPTPCPDWDVRALVSHVVAGNTLFAGALTGSLAAGPPAQPAAGLPQAYRDSAAALLAAFREPGALERTVAVPFGTVPGIIALHLRMTELLVHGWDIARATGQAAPFPEELAAAELDFTVQHLPDVSPDRSPFAPPQPVDPGAPALDRLSACLGRDVTARPAAGHGA